MLEDFHIALDDAVVEAILAGEYLANEDDEDDFDSDAEEALEW